MLNEHFALLYGTREREEDYRSVFSPTQKLDRPDALFLCDYSIIGTGPISISSSYLLHYFELDISTRTPNPLIDESQIQKIIKKKESMKIMIRNITQNEYTRYKRNAIIGESQESKSIFTTVVAFIMVVWLKPSNSMTCSSFVLIDVASLFSLSLFHYACRVRALFTLIIRLS